MVISLWTLTKKLLCPNLLHPPRRVAGGSKLSTLNQPTRSSHRKTNKGVKMKTARLITATTGKPMLHRRLITRALIHFLMIILLVKYLAEMRMLMMPHLLMSLHEMSISVMWILLMALPVEILIALHSLAMTMLMTHLLLISLSRIYHTTNSWRMMKAAWMKLMMKQVIGLPKENDTTRPTPWGGRGRSSKMVQRTLKAIQ